MASPKGLEGVARVAGGVEGGPARAEVVRSAATVGHRQLGPGRLVTFTGNPLLRRSWRNPAR